jgi:hypothetical protein
MTDSFVPHVSIPQPPELADLTIPNPDTRVGYPRLLFYQEAYGDSSGPVQEWLRDLRRHVHDRATEMARKWLRDIHREAYEEGLVRLASSGEEEAERELVQWLSRLPSGGTLRQLRRLILEDAPRVADMWAGEAARYSPSEEQIGWFTTEAGASIWKDQEGLRQQAEEVAYRLGIHQRAHDWLTHCLLWDAYVVLHWERYLKRGGTMPVGELFPWRKKILVPPRREVAHRVLFRWGEMHLWDKQLDDAKAHLKSLRRAPPGPRPVPLPEDVLAGLAYRWLRGDTLPALAGRCRWRRTEKTLGRHLDRFIDSLFPSGASNANAP